MPTDNIEMLQTVADGLKELKYDIVFVGGAVAELYADDMVLHIREQRRCRVIYQVPAGL